MTQQRHFTRIPFDAKARITNPMTHQNWSTHLLDISLKGAKLSCPLDWQAELQQHFEIELLLSEVSDDMVIKMQAELVHQCDTLLGFKCLHLDLDSATHLHRLVELNLGNSKLLDREYNELLSLTSTK